MNELRQLPIPLLSWYRENARALPWRSAPTPYHVWISEIMLQQTRVAAVPTDQLMKLWQGLGYYSRARNLQKAAKQITERHGGVFPNTYEDIRALAGVGDYTAGAVASIAFRLPIPAVDGNVLRVTARVTGDTGDITTTAMKKKVTAALGKVIPLDAQGEMSRRPPLPRLSGGSHRGAARQSGEKGPAGGGAHRLSALSRGPRGPAPPSGAGAAGRALGVPK